jgi:hypothetical protein
MDRWDHSYFENSSHFENRCSNFPDYKMSMLNIGMHSQDHHTYNYHCLKDKNANDDTLIGVRLLDLQRPLHISQRTLLPSLLTRCSYLVEFVTNWAYSTLTDEICNNPYQGQGHDFKSQYALSK